MLQTSSKTYNCQSQTRSHLAAGQQTEGSPVIQVPSQNVYTFLCTTMVTSTDQSSFVMSTSYRGVEKSEDPLTGILEQNWEKFPPIQEDLDSTRWVAVQRQCWPIEFCSQPNSLSLLIEEESHFISVVWQWSLLSTGGLGVALEMGVQSQRRQFNVIGASKFMR